MMLCGAVVFHQRVNPRVERRSEVLSIALNKDHLYLSLSPSTSLNLLVQAVLRVWKYFSMRYEQYYSQ